MTKKNDLSVLTGKSSSSPFQDRKNENKLIVINGLEVIEFLDSEYHLECLAWERGCAQVRKSFRQKTSRSVKNWTEYESTRWYKVSCDGSMKSTGSSEEPEYEKLYSPEPKPRYEFTVWIPKSCLHRDEHIVIEEKDYKENLKIFKDCLVFMLSNCENYMHPLHANPDKNLSVRVPLAAGSAGMDRKEMDASPPHRYDIDPEFPDDEDDKGGDD
jgi:hypothetical protein